MSSLDSPTEAPAAAEQVPGKTWTKLKKLGVGGYGEVWKVRYLNSEEAWKFIPKKRDASVQAFRETFNARSINHSNIVRIQDILEDEEHFIIRMDLVRGRNLHIVVRDDGVLSPLAVCRFAMQLAGALAAAHKVGVLHLDLKPSNILLKDDGERVLITDFGISATTTKGFFQVDPARPAGTPYFLAPEQVRARGGAEARFGPGVDIWALGITLYFLLARGYPFDFKDGDPSIILEAEPRPIHETVPYVDDELWAVLARMLARDPGERYQSMDEVRAAFNSYVTEVTCPACKRTFPMDHVHGVCPEVNCPDPPRVVALKDRRQRLRGGHHYFSRCEHLKAVGAYNKVIEMEESGEKVYSERARRLVTIAEADRKVLAKRTEVIRGAFEGNDLLRAVKEVDRARTRFSAAQELTQLRQEVQAAIQERYQNVVATCSKLVKETRFADAKLLLTQIEGFLGYEPVRRRLEEWEEEKGRQAPPVQDLFNFVDEREQFFNACHEELGKRVRKLQLDKAAVCLQRLGKHFPESVQSSRVRLYSQLHDSLRFVRSCDPAAIEKILDADEGALPASRIELKRAETECGRLVEGLAGEKPEGLAEVVALKETLERVNQRLRERVEALQAKAEAAERDGRLRDQKTAIEGLSAIADRTDLLDIEGITRIRVLQERVEATVRRAEEKYREGRRLIEENNYGPAQIAFEASASIAPGLFPDIAEKIAELQQLQEENLAIGEQMAQLFNRIMGENVTLDDFRSYFQLSQQSMPKQEQLTMMDLAQRSNRVFSRLFTVQGNKMGKIAQPSGRLEVLRETVDIIEGEPEKGLAVNLLKKGSELNERALELFGRIFAPLERSEDEGGDLDHRIDHVRGVVAEMGRIRESVRLLSPLKYHAHPAERASAVLVGLRPAILDAPDPRARLAAVSSLHDELPPLVGDDATLRHIARNGSAIKRAVRGVALAKVLHRLGRIGVKGAIPVSTALAVGIVLYIYFQAQRGQDRRELALDVLKPALRGYGVAFNEVNEDKLSGVKRDNRGFAEFMGSLFVVGRSDPPPAVETLDALGRWIEGKRREKEGLAYLAGLAAGETRRRLDDAIVKIGNDAAARVRAYLAERFRIAADSALKGDLSVDLEALHRDIRGVERLAESVREGAGPAIERVRTGLKAAAAITAPGSRGLPRIDTAPQWKRWLEEARGLSLETGTPELDGALLEVLCLARLGTAVQSLAARSRAIFWSGQAVGEYVAYSREAVAAFTALADHLRGSAALAGLRERLPAELALRTDAIQQKVWAVVREILRK